MGPSFQADRMTRDTSIPSPGGKTREAGSSIRSKPVLVIGATGYVGGRLVPRLLESGYRVRVMARSLSKVICRPWGNHPMVEISQGDVLDLDSLRKATSGCSAAFYLVHAMSSARENFALADRKAAYHMAVAAAEARLDRIIYLGGLGRDDDPTLSEHLRSRHEVGRILQSGPVPTTILRAAMILGSGSASFEMLRYLADRLLVMITPRWVQTPVQPISIRNVLGYLLGCLEHEETRGQTYDIGGPEVLTYEKMIHIYADVAGLPRRRIFPLPFLSPHLSALWIHLITPVPASIARPLAEGLRNEVVCQDHRIRSIIPQDLMTARETTERALEKMRLQRVETRWIDAGVLLPPEWVQYGDAQYAGGTILEYGSSVLVEATPEELWAFVSQIGGRTGWYFGNPLWMLRGLLDRLLGGYGLRRGRRHSLDIYVGDALDFWRVLEIRPCRRLLLLSEMKMPGEATLEFKILPAGRNRVELRQLSRFVPRGLLGILYWYSLYPFHEWIFSGMLTSIAKKAGKVILKGPDRFTPKLRQS